MRYDFMDRDFSHKWWMDTPGAARMIARTAEQCLCSGSVIMSELAPSLWPEKFYECVFARIQQENSAMRFMVIDESELNSADDRELALLERANYNAGFEYRPASWKSIAEYAAKTNAFQEMTIVIRHIVGEHADAWLHFAADYARSCQDGALLLAFDQGFPTREFNRKNVLMLLPADWITEIDLLSLALFAGSSTRHASRIGSDYLARLAVALCRGYPEVCCRISQLGELDTLDQDLVELAGEYPSVSTLRAGTQEYDRKRWEVQIQTIFPALELCRCGMIRKWEAELSERLPLRDEYGIEIHEVSDIELRHIVYFLNQHWLILPGDEYMHVFEVYNARNRLAHLRILDSKTLKNLITLCEMY